MSQVDRLFVLAGKWQEKHQRNLESLAGKVDEELMELLEEESGSLEQLDEIGDVIVNALRLFYRLDKIEREFVVRSMEMKADQRFKHDKNKAREAVLMYEIASKLGLK